jgi:hypothetical protein
MKRIVLSYIIIVIIEMLYTYFYLDHWDDFKKEEVDKKIEFNNAHVVELEKYFSNEVNERVKLLDTMSYNDWIGYNKKNKYVTFDGKKYYFFIALFSNTNSYFVIQQCTRTFHSTLFEIYQ